MSLYTLYLAIAICESFRNAGHVTARLLPIMLLILPIILSRKSFKVHL